MPEAMGRTCAACGSAKVTVVPRGFTGRTDTADQYRLCQECGHVTYEIVAVSQRDLRLHRYAPEGLYERDGRRYTIRRVLKVGFNEYLLYVQPESGDSGAPVAVLPQRPSEHVTGAPSRL